MPTTVRIPTTKLGKQLNGYILLNYDMKFAARAFALAARRAVRSTEERPFSALAENLSRLLQTMDPLLRAGATVGQLDEDDSNESEIEKRALFEAGILTYGRCFNSGLRVHLSAKTFSGDLSGHKALHEAMIKIRNKHIAHSELKMEQAVVGFQFIHNTNYGKRPSIVLAGLTMRRHYPNNDRLVNLETHCRAIAEKFIEPKLLETARALREQLLQMPAEQIERFPEFVRPSLDELF